MAISPNTVAELSRLYAKRTKVRAAMKTVTQPGAAAEMWIEVASVMTTGTGTIADMAYAIADGGDLDDWLKVAALARLEQLDKETTAAIEKAGGEV